MAILRNTIQNNSRGHTGAVVYFSRFGKQMQRSFPKHYHDKNSAAQQDQRFARFKPCLEYARQLKSFAKGFYAPQPIGKSAFSMLMKQLAPAFQGTFSSPTFVPRFSTIGSGDLPRLDASAIEKATTSSIKVTWLSALDGPFDADDDVVSFVISDMDGKNVYHKTTGALRSAGMVTFGVPGILTGSEVQISNPIFVSADGLHVSPFILTDSHSPVDLS